MSIKLLKLLKVSDQSFQYSKEQAEQFLNNISYNLQSKDSHNTEYVIIHKGLDGYFKWKNDDKSDVINDACQNIDRLNR